MPQLRDLPAVDTLLSAIELSPLIQHHGTKAVRDEIRTLQDQIRVNRVVPNWALTPTGYLSAIDETLSKLRYTPIFNLTGTVIHTNLGRALLSDACWQEAQALVTRPMNLEFDLATGRRGDRDAIVERRLCRLIGCEAATVVNNGAAALLLCLNTFAQNKKVPVSRGELIEIGGSFRLPELMARSGCELLEVGTTNRTHVADFEAVLDEAAMLLKVHPSNFYIGGFSAAVSAAELAELALKQGIPSCVDLGSGSLVDLTKWGLPAEPAPQAVLNDGIDVVTFSGDKLLGGVQAGLIVGKKNELAKIKTNPLKRALRADKITLALLDATLKRYEDPDTLLEHIPVLKTLTLTNQELQRRADHLLPAFPASWHAQRVTTQAQIGSGALPDKTIPSVGITVNHKDKSPDEIAAQLRALATPVIGRINDNKVWLDMHGAEPLEALHENLLVLTP